ncbi:hypothetical protein V492_05386, partial [Pseudogymnoascus sp. VKM F-4246]
MHDISQDAQEDRKVIDKEKGETLSIHSTDTLPDNDSSSFGKQDGDAYDGADPITKTESNVVRRVLTHLSARTSNVSIGPPPDGGFHAWLQCAMACMTVTTTWGFVNSFGMFQSFYVGFLDRPPSDIAWIGGFQVFFLFFVGTFSGRLADAGYFKQVIFVGSFLQLLGIFMASISTQYWQLILSHGICVGLGNGCIFAPAVALVSTYFSTKKSLAIGISASGGAIGGLIFPSMVQNLLPKIGFAWTMRSLGLVDAILLLCVNLFAKQRVPPRRSGQFLDLNSFRDLTYTLYGVGMFFTFWGLYFPFFYLSAFARDKIGFEQTKSINLVLLLNGVGIPARIIANYIADTWTGPLNLMLFAALGGSIVMFSMIAVHDTAGLYTWTVIYGTPGASVQSLFPAVLGSLTSKDLSKAGVRIGMIFTMVSFAVLSGPPICGALITAGNGSYLGPQIFTACSILLGCGLMCGARFATTGTTIKGSVFNVESLRPDQSRLSTPMSRSPPIKPPVSPQRPQFSRTSSVNTPTRRRRYPNAHMSSYPPPPPTYSTSSLSHPEQSANDNKHDLINQLHAASAQSYSYDGNTRPLQFASDGSIPNPNAQQQHIGNGQQSASQTAAQLDAQKGNRLRKACDSCSIRKVKCDEEGPPCRACAALEIPCTFERPSRRRGPPNRHAESIKRRRLEEGSPSGQFATSSPTSPSNVAATLASFSSHAVLSAESI